MPLWLSEEDVGSLVTTTDAVPLIEACFGRMATGEVELMPRRRFRVDGGHFAVMAAADRALGVAGLKSYTLVDGRLAFVVCLFDLTSGELVATIAADRLGQMRTGAASGVAAKHLARKGATTLGVIGTGGQAASQVEAIRAAVPGVERILAWSRTPERVDAFCARTGAEAASPAEVGACDVVVTVTTAREPVLEGDWLSEGALVCAVGANHPTTRELDDRVIARAGVVCCDSIEDARLESGDLLAPVASGLLDWRDVHELHEIVSGAVAGRRSDAEIVLFKSNGIAPWDVALAHELVRRAREQGVGLELPG